MAKKIAADVTSVQESTADKEMRILTAARVVKIGDEEIQVKPYSWANTFRLAKPFGSVFGAVTAHLKDIQVLLNDLEGQGNLSQFKLMTDFIGSIDEAENIITSLTELIVLSTKLDKDKVENLLLDDFIRLGIAVYDVNRDFFLRRLGPMMPKPRLKEKAKAEK